MEDASLEALRCRHQGHICSLHLELTVNHLEIQPLLTALNMLHVFTIEVKHFQQWLNLCSQRSSVFICVSLC